MNKFYIFPRVKKRKDDMVSGLIDEVFTSRLKSKAYCIISSCKSLEKQGDSFLMLFESRSKVCIKLFVVNHNSKYDLQ